MKTEQLLELIREHFDVAEYDEDDRCIVLHSRRNGVFRFERFAKRVLEAAPAVEVEPSGREVLRNVFALCEDTEDFETNTPNDFLRGRKFEAKRIRNAIGTWFADECNSRKAAPEVEPTVKESLTVGAVKPFAYTSKAGLNYENIGENYGALPVRSCMVFGDFDHIFDQPIWLHPIIKNYSIDAETRALALSICEHVLSHTHPWAFIDEAKKLKKLLGAE